MEKWIDIKERSLPEDKLPIKVRFMNGPPDISSLSYITEGILVSIAFNIEFGTSVEIEVKIVYSNGQKNTFYGKKSSITHWLEEKQESVLSRFELLDL